jgi:predicted transcriptional regulator
MVMLDEGTGFSELLSTVLNENEAYYYVRNDEGRYQGSFSVHDVKEIMNEQSLAGLVVAKDLVPISASPAIEHDATLAECMRRFGIYETEELPVIDTKESRQLIGRVSRRDIINLYNREILKQGSLGLKFIQSKLPGQASTENHVDLPEGVEISVLPLTKEMEGHTVKTLDIRAVYGVTIVAINRRGDRGVRKAVIPDPDEVFRKGDMLVLIGTGEALGGLKDAYNIEKR